MNNTKWSEEEEKILIDKYSYTKNEDLSLILNKSKDAIRNKAKRLKLKTDKKIVNKKYEVNSLFFEQPNIINSYVAGFTLADGYVVPDKRVVRYKLSHIDKDLLRNIAKASNFTGPVIDYTEKTNDGRKKEHKTSWLTIVDEKWVADLERNFLVSHISKKNNDCKFPYHLSHDNKIAFIHGVIDGDGCISISKNKIEISVCGSKDLIIGIADFCKEITLSDYKNYHKYNSIYVYKVSGKKAIKLINELNKFTELHNIHLSRKWDKVKEWKI